MKTRTLLAGLAAGTLAASANAAIVSATLTTDAASDNGTAAGAGGVGTLQDGVIAGTALSDNFLTADPGGFPSDYIASQPAPIILNYDFGSAVTFGSLNYGAYSSGGQNAHPNSATEFLIQTSTDGVNYTSGESITVPSFDHTIGVQLISLAADITAQFARVTVTDNGFVAPGDGTGGGSLGGDRVGFSELSFDDTPAIPEPGSLALLGLGGLALLRRRR